MSRAVLKTALCALLGLCLLPKGLEAQSGKYGAAFLDFGVGARALAMGGAFVAPADDGSAFYWNPSGLTGVSAPQLAFMYASAFGSIVNPLATYNHLGVSVPLHGGATIAANYVRLAVDDIPIFPELRGESFGQRLLDPTLRPDGQPLGYFSDREEAFVLSFAKMNTLTTSLGWLYTDLSLEIPIGISFRMVRQRLYGFRATGFGVDLGSMIRLDVGALFDTPWVGTFSSGLALVDVAGTAMTWNTRHQDRIAQDLRLGLAYSQPMPWRKSTLLVCWSKKERPAASHHWGLEYRLPWLALRLGIDNGKLTAGAGFDFWRLTVDYGFVSGDLGNVHRVSGSLVIGRRGQR
ncbi:MAG: hypothetical protein QHJ34_14430 [bacterium]|jgi:hypothetical protein|nr:hypothetical protein [candidate division KSB1 bacterium]MDH7561407.1 hypothetical protein [bacterium]